MARFKRLQARQLLGVRCDEIGALREAASARAMSGAPQDGARVITSIVAGLTTSSVASAMAACSNPPTSTLSAKRCASRYVAAGSTRDDGLARTVDMYFLEVSGCDACSVHACFNAISSPASRRRVWRRFHSPWRALPL